LRDVTVRKPYGRRDVRGPSVCSLIGTLNDTGAGFLNDPTGSRRALTISLARIDWSYTDRVDVNQVWAQAVALYRAGESPYLLDDERETQAKINAGFETVDPVDDVLVKELEINPKQFDWVMPSAEVLWIVDANLKGTSAQHARSVAAALKKRGIEVTRTYINGTQVRGYRGIRPRKVDEFAHLQDATRRQDGT
jgi:predicted P-loop ATPase